MKSKILVPKPECWQLHHSLALLLLPICFSENYSLSKCTAGCSSCVFNVPLIWEISNWPLIPVFKHSTMPPDPLDYLVTGGNPFPIVQDSLCKAQRFVLLCNQVRVHPTPADFIDVGKALGPSNRLMTTSFPDCSQNALDFEEGNFQWHSAWGVNLFWTCSPC